MAPVIGRQGLYLVVMGEHVGDNFLGFGQPSNSLAFERAGQPSVLRGNDVHLALA